MSKRKQGGADRHAHPKISFHCERSLLDALQRYIDAQRVKPDKSAVGRAALEEFLEREGFWPPAADRQADKG